MAEVKKRRKNKKFETAFKGADWRRVTPLHGLTVGGHFSTVLKVKVKVKVKVWVLVIALLTRLEQQRFTISEVAADWHELKIPWRIMRPSIARDGGHNWTRGAAHRHTTAPISALGLHPVAGELLLISRPAEGRRLSNFIG